MEFKQSNTDENLERGRTSDTSSSLGRQFSNPFIKGFRDTPWNVVHDYFTIDVKGLMELDTSKPITKELYFNQLVKYTIQLGFCHLTQLGSNAYYKNFGYG
ncbi:hypothetical protein TNCT_74681 [Trichonephila clavata]|uniref:Uncharacterized protein n=1 Tax=Trichonephila clavata TaxID=2740835 RepID=A0A8X6LH62_TRICU|nr:hypothetical protein TNCT_74681 [Trichonephila clavata]